MNRYVAQGLIRDAFEHGRHVAVVVRRGRIREAFSAVDDALTERDSAVIYRTNGRERIEFAVTGGRITFHAPNDRGASPDVVYVEGWNDLSVQMTHNVLVMARRGELIRA